jgi:hypothetical protein
MVLRPKLKCEICGLKKPSILHRHHVIPRPDSRCTNSDNNLAILCPNCHSSVHLGEITIIGIYKSTEGTGPVWFKKGEDFPFPQEYWKVKDNPFVKTLKGNEDDLSEL